MSVHCERCGVKLEEGALRYVVTINVTADFDGVLPAEGEIEDLEAFMRRIDKKGSGRAEHDVFQSKAFILCPVCKAELMKHPLGAAPPEDEGEDEGRVH